jgi:hypothetical protein
MGNAYHLAPWKELEKTSGLIITYQNTREAEQSILKLFRGEIGANGRLPVSVKNWFEAGSGALVGEKADWSLQDVR